MIICENCFEDREIVNIIRNNGALSFGRCPTCDKDGHLYDTDTNMELTQYIDSLLNMYTSISFVTDSSIANKAVNLADDVNRRWHLFSDAAIKSSTEILKSVSSLSLDDEPNIFSEKVVIQQLYNEEYLEHHSLLRNSSWDTFVLDLKTKNRYHSKHLNLEVFNSYCNMLQKVYKAGTKFYRARISSAEPFPRDKMLNPPLGKSRAGRANAQGITCLYLSNDMDTALHEVRAGAYDYVSVGTITLNEDISIVNLRDLEDISPFRFPSVEDYISHAVNRDSISRLNEEMSKPLRRTDEAIDYVPTQFFVDYIRSIEDGDKPKYNGIEYKSTLSDSGYNLAIFTPDLLECTSVSLIEINRLNYDYSEIG